MNDDNRVAPPNTPRTLALLLRCGALVALLTAAARHADAQDFPPEVSPGAEQLDLKALFEQSIPRSPFATVVYRYADTMLERGRDDHGARSNPLFLSALDRKTLAPLNERPVAPAGLAEEHRPGGPRRLTGAEPQSDQNLLRLLYFLRDLSSQARYEQAADEALSWLLRDGQSPQTGLLPWGESLCWDVIDDRVTSAGPAPTHRFRGPWMLWDRCFALAPKESERLALALLERHAVDRGRGVFAAGADYGAVSETADNEEAGRSGGLRQESPRHAGFFIRAWAVAHARTGRDEFSEAIEAVVNRWEERLVTDADVDPAAASATEENESRENKLDEVGRLSLAIDADGAARRVPEPLRGRLHRLAKGLDRRFCSLPHDLSGDRGFVTTTHPREDDSRRVQGVSRAASLWDMRRGPTVAGVGVLCVSRYENTGGTEYRELVVKAADRYQRSIPDRSTDAWPLTFGQAITLQLSAYRVTGRPRYFRRAYRLGEIAIERFFDDGALPRASLKSDHYESVTGAGTLVLALAELHLTTLHITAVRAPANTIDR